MSDLPDIVRLDQPESPDRTRDLGNLLAETVRALNYSTLGDAPGLVNPGDAYSLLGALYTATGGLPQLIGQLDAFLTRLASDGRLRDDHGENPVAVTAVAGVDLESAAEYARLLTDKLQSAQSLISGLGMKDAGDV